MEGLRTKKIKTSHKGDGHRKRLREKFLSSGLTGFSDYEVIELLLTIATPRKDCKQTAKAALKRFVNLQGVFEASFKELCEVEGIGKKNLFGIKLVKAVADRYLEKKLINTNPVNNSKQLIDFLKLDIRDRSRECFKIIFLNAKNKIIETGTLFTGTLTATSVYPREVVRAALNQKAAALIFAHNHPSGDPTPSSEDISITRELIFACKVMGIIVHEHIIIGDNSYYSFADEGHIAEINRAYEKR